MTAKKPRAKNRFILPLAVSGLVDAISMTVVAPSILFYILESGGTRDQYGLVLSSFSLASFCAKPFLGSASDGIGFRTPYLLTHGIAAAGSLLYTVAGEVLPHGTAAVVGGIGVARLCMGGGSANSTLGFCYIARAVPQKELTTTSFVLVLTWSAGMAAGPILNAALAMVDIPLFGGRFLLGPLNSVGVLTFLINVGAMVVIYYFLEELDDGVGEEEKGKYWKANDHNNNSNSKLSILSEVLSARILVPCLAIFSLNASLQL
mmetsp:Transcript_41232/g.80695  ORF Transcript_41232/g.80695 Transcript_41232/m.80695 type:complete len:262 (+) Transcript_41232:95-880(+)